MTENQKLREALQAFEKRGTGFDSCPTRRLPQSDEAKQIDQWWLRYFMEADLSVRSLARQALALRPEQVPMTCEPGEWNSIQIASWIGSKLMHEPPMFERATVCKFVRSLGRHPTLLKHSPKSHPAPSVPTADHIPDAGKMIETAAPVGEREAFEAWLGITPCGAAHDFGWDAWQARAALSAGDAVDAQRYRWLADCNNYEAGLALIIDPKLTEQALGAAIDAAMRKDKP